MYTHEVQSFSQILSQVQKSGHWQSRGPSYSAILWREKRPFRTKDLGQAEERLRAFPYGPSPTPALTFSPCLSPSLCSPAKNHIPSPHRLRCTHSGFILALLPTVSILPQNAAR